VNATSDISTTDLETAWERGPDFIPTEELDLVIPPISIFATGDGFVGLGPARMKAGDKVFLLLGGNVSFILRPTEPNNEDGKYFTLVGQCYIPELMSGQGLVAAHVTKYPESKQDYTSFEEFEEKEREWLSSLGEGPFPFDTQEAILC
jgi:hypothetical protein